jgi:hypothetical protein
MANQARRLIESAAIDSENLSEFQNTVIRVSWWRVFFGPYWGKANNIEQQHCKAVHRHMVVENLVS